MSRSQSLHMKSEQAEDVAVLQCAGRIVRGEALHLLKNAVTSLPRMRVIVLDLSGVEMLDCGGLGMLVSLQGWTRNNGIQLKLVHPSNFAREMFERTGLTCVLHISSVGDAVDVLRKSDDTDPSQLSVNDYPRESGMGAIRHGSPIGPNPVTSRESGPKGLLR